MIKFPRKTKIFKGEFQAGPFAAVFLWFLVFLTFNTAIVYIPGLPLDLAEAGLRLNANQMASVQLQPDATFRFKAEEFRTFDLFENRLRGEVKTNGLKLLVLQVNPALTNQEAARRIVEVARELKLLVDMPGSKVELPVTDSLIVATNPTISVVINLAGEVYFQSQVVTDGQLRERLAEAMRQMARTPSLIVLADRTVSYETITRVGSVARLVGITQVILAARPPLFESATEP
ncbi:MAG: biopolymer transporter ExbD [Verrucomicrobiota bacterium]